MAENTQSQQRLRMVNIIGPEGTVIAQGVLISPNAEDVTVKNQVGQGTDVSANLKDFLFKKFSSTTETDDEGTVTIRTVGNGYFSIDPSKISILQSWSDYQNLNKKRLVGLYDKDENNNIVYIADFLSGIENLDPTLAQFETTDTNANITAVKNKYDFKGYTPVTGVENGDFTTGAQVSADNQAKEFMASFGNSSFWQQIIDREIENKNRLLGLYGANGEVAGYFESTIADLEEIKKIYPNLTNEEVYNLVIDSNKKSLYQRIVDREMEDKNRLLGVYDANGNVVGYFEPTEANIEVIQEAYDLDYEAAYNLTIDLNKKSLYQHLIELNNFWQDLPSEEYNQDEQSGKNIATKYDIDGLSWEIEHFEQDNYSLNFGMLSDGSLAVTGRRNGVSSDIIIPSQASNNCFITCIAGGAFYKDSYINTVALPETLKEISKKAFEESHLLSINLSNVKTIKNNAFRKCEKINSLTIGGDIGEYAFESCTSLKSVTIGSGVTLIGYRAFYNCSSLTSVTIGSGDTLIQGEALQIGSNTNLATITFLGIDPPRISASAFDASKLEKIIVPKGRGNAYKTATNWAKFADKIQEAIA